ncbi:NAD(P)-binding protein [Gymnopus androsaceus JB14]|uniref:NAD(P)-binding protein n=1 Tax=Gymnopus androsaceus JB14 TaxID=1447944 RepID=A0A6A4H3J9_9AGAR|nr:NAD(P)-binding protein [Gymnopus androsaceus JB14]
MTTQPLSIFLLGATGYVGGEVLVSFSTDFPTFPIRALARNLSPNKITQLQSLHPKVQVIEGTLADVDLIEAEAAKADIVISVASAGDMESIAGEYYPPWSQTTKRFASSSIPTPIYIHMSGLGLAGENARGELITPERLWTDTEFSLNDIKQNSLSGASEAIVEASKSGEIRTMILLPGLIYGVGRGIYKSSVAHRMLLNFAAQAGHSGTFGPGRNVLGIIHIKDTASAVSAVLRGALNGSTIGEGEKVFCLFFCNFLISKYMISTSEFCGIIGDTLFKSGLISKPGSSPFSASITDAAPFVYLTFGCNTFCRAERLHTDPSSLSENLPYEIELAVKEAGVVFNKGN